MRYLKIIFFSLGFLLAACSQTPSDKILQQGQAAYHVQDYHTAFRLLLTAANEDNPQAQYAIGYMYYYGIGTLRDPIEAVKWLKKSAENGNNRAANAIYLLQHNGPSAFDFGRSSV